VSGEIRRFYALLFNTTTKCVEVFYYSYYSEVTVGTADKLLNGKCSTPCVVDVVDFLIIVDIL
jgi:hypothetical protein